MIANLLMECLVAPTFAPEPGTLNEGLFITWGPAPKIARLDWVLPGGGYEAWFSWGTGIPDFFTEYEWTFSGAGVQPTTSSLAVPTVKANQPGIVTGSVVVTRFGVEIFPGTKKSYVIGGPFSISSTRTQKREQRTGQPSNLKQPLILEYFGASYEQTPNTISAVSTLGGQPAGTEYEWILSGPLQATTGLTSSSVTFKASGPSGRGSASPTLKFKLTVIEEEGGAPVSAEVVDCTDNKRSQDGINPDTGYRKVSCHAPAHVYQSPIAKETYVNTMIGGPPEWGIEKWFAMQLFSSISDPFKHIWVQERFPDGVPTKFDDDTDLDDFKWNGNPPPGNPIIPWVSGEATGVASHSGYTYHAKFIDKIGFYG